MPMPTTKAVTAAGYMTSDCLSEEFSRRRIYITGEICDALAAEGSNKNNEGNIQDQTAGSHCFW